MNKAYAITKILISPKVRLLVDDDMALRMLDHLDQMVTQPSNDFTFEHGPSKSWGIELAAEEDSNRVYRVAFVVEERPEPDEETYLTMIAIEEGVQLELPPSKREQLADWKVIVP